MKLSKWQVGLVVCSIITLTACSSHRRQDQAAINASNAAYGSTADQGAGAYASGLGDRTRFKDHGQAAQSISKRTYYFDFDSNVIHESDKPAIIANANYLTGSPRVKVILEGHTDPRGSREYNIGLGERRAKTVANMLTANGVSPGQLRVVSYGAEKLATPGHTEADYQLDRRVVLVYLK
jgi:peptidoglycan-associated lipoprotein